MNERSFEAGANMQRQTKENDAYDNYRTLGGIINEKDYTSALGRAEKTATLNTTLVQQAKNIATYAGIVLKNSGDPRVNLYAALRADNKPKDVEHHHSQMSDQRLFAEALRMLGDTDALNKTIAAYPNISF
ncbi:hypothetical protein A2673_04045 [Candidatus Kaiserbacteria bacterium RIFCSPHIGHO2_01_FULL_50_13]|uniref:Uncharacterized protein n=1 Tax=Candidatus Kaiserbacteria bacterium RIFCSPLOWO2_01_FULL_50_24 TaxID=1798507 RepID=A0A1F6ENC9_9BACT|nr:MAG: hypothetical protein A2673_04045 [Candidatus Kaiserbacteria bacterium RIFCSPHIGHO2_01_FULL_50_13]OGG75156.1 MAG: hypothetical protein A3A34_02260 [Candidatus Kaiserbacteria bacterium RIFCSPLOWO2_01_FULL_50_24]OGG81065.1 MAG: hypothetical protein A3H74_04050 [Candidatus Kaiserbacteria bacterium RIFCSPLOWO2_02_FULL_51_13]